VTRVPSLGPRGEGWVVAQVVLFVALAVAGQAGPQWGGALLVLTAVTGALLIGAGAILAIRGVLDLRGSLTALPKPRPDGTLVETGSYRLVRHPIYGGIVLAAFGWGLATASWPALILAAATSGFFAMKSHREEAWLIEHYAGYEAYQARTRRMVPFLY
jgi:protein-S-isoprenylcysteine O-methyltransferase Ste14